MKIVQVKKISHAILNKLEKELKQVIPHGIMLGRVTRAIPGSNDKGEFLKCTGSFALQIPSEQLEYRAPVCYFPAIVEMAIADAVASALRENSQGFAGIEFAVKIWKSPSEKSVTGYEWNFEHLIKPDVPDVVDLISSRVLALMPAPTNETEPTDEPAPTTEPEARKPRRK